MSGSGQWFRVDVSQDLDGLWNWTLYDQDAPMADGEDEATPEDAFRMAAEKLNFLTDPAASPIKVALYIPGAPLDQ